MPIALPDSWHVEHLKLVGYLLDLDHPVGGPKARFFRRYGFAPDHPDHLAEALFEHVASVPFHVMEMDKSTRLVFEGPLLSPLGIMPRLRSVWLSILEGSGARLLTAYPYDER